MDTVNRVVPQLIARGKYIRESLGVGVDADINWGLTKQPGIEGVLLLKVESGSVADAAGLRGTKIDRDGDIIIAFKVFGNTSSNLAVISHPNQDFLGMLRFLTQQAPTASACLCEFDTMCI